LFFFLLLLLLFSLVAAYILGEFGSLISEDRDSTPSLQFQALHNLWPFVSNSTRAVLLNSYGKFSFLYGADRQLVANIQSVFQYYSASLDEEIQQRASEYNGLLRLPNQAILEKTWDPMPAFKDDDMMTAAVAETYEPPIVDLQGMGAYNAAGNNNNLGSHQQLQNELQARLAAAPSTAAAATAVGGVIEPTPELLAAHDGLYRQLWLNSEGFLYRDERLQVGVRSQVQAGVFHLMLYFGNSSGVELTNFVVLVPNVDYLQIVTKPISPVISAGQQASQLLSIGCVKVGLCVVLILCFFEKNHG
jgi:AP-2 complex subunit alpha